MVFSLQQLDDDSKFSHALRFEVLAEVCPRELVSELLTRCHAWGERERSLNQLLVVYYVIGLSLFRRLNLAAVCLRLPTAAALVYRRRQLGTPVIRHLFQRVCRPMASEQTKGAFRFGLRLMAIDGTLDEVADTPANAQYFGRMSSGKHQSPFPQVRCVYPGRKWALMPSSMPCSPPAVSPNSNSSQWCLRARSNQICSS